LANGPDPASTQTIGIKGFAEGEIATWTEDEIEQFKQRWACRDQPERMAFALLLYTGQRRSDVVRIVVARTIDGKRHPRHFSRRPEPR